MALPPITRTPEQLDAILRAGSGELVDTPYPVLLLALALREKSAVMTLHRNPLLKEILFDDGAPIDCVSNIATETFGRFLVSAGKLSEEDCHAALALSATRGVPLEEILSEQKTIPSTELYRMLQQSLGRKLLDPFSWKSGTFELSFDVPPVESALRVKVPQLVLTGVLKVDTQESVDEVMSFARDAYLGVATNPLFDLHEIRLTTEQEKILDAARDSTRYSDVAESTGVDEDDVHRITYAFLLLGALTVSETPVRVAPRFELENPFRKNTMESPLPPVELPPVQVEPPRVEPPKTVVTQAAAAEEVVAAYLSHRRKDAFDLLEVAETDGPVQFQRAFLRMSDRFLPSKFDEHAPDGLRDKAQEVFLATARAYAEVIDPVRREAILALRLKKTSTTREVPEPTTLIVPVPAATEKTQDKLAERKTIKAAIIDPELLCQNGRELAEAGKLREALSSFEMAAQCDAQNGIYAAEVAWCRFRLHVSPATTTLKMLKNAIRIDPRCGLANLYAGNVAATLGNRSEAGTFLNRAAMLMPRDMRVVEALKALG